MQLLGIIIAIELLGMLLAGNGFSLRHYSSLIDTRQRLQLAQADSVAAPATDITPAPLPPPDSGLPQPSAPTDDSLQTSPDIPSPQDALPPPDQTPGSPDSATVEPPVAENNDQPIAPQESLPTQEPELTLPQSGEELPSFEPQQSINPSPDGASDGSNALSPPESITSEPDRKNTADVSESAPPVASDVTAPEEALADVSHIDTETIEKARIEDNQLANTEAPEAKTELLINFANESVDDVNTSLEKNNFSGVNFIVQRLDDQITNALNQLEQVAPDQQLALQAKIQKFSQLADSELRNQQLVVPEELEQDMEIVRGRLLLLQR